MVIIEVFLKCSTAISFLQTALLDFCKELEDEQGKRSLANAEQALCMIQQVVEYKKCSALIEPDSLLRQLLELLRMEKLTDSICFIISYILLNASKLPQELSSSVIIGVRIITIHSVSLNRLMVNISIRLALFTNMIQATVDNFIL